VCDLDHDFDDGSGFTAAEWRTARKSHKCGECGRGIPRGSRYRKMVGTYAGDFWSDKFCSRCAKCQDWLLARGHGWVGGSIVSDVRYCVQQELAEKGSIRNGKAD